VRSLTVLFLLITVFSCKRFSLSNQDKSIAIDTIVDFSSVDSYPTFDNCNELIEKEEKSFCFRETIYQKIGEELDKAKLESNDTLNEAVLVKLRINSKGIFTIDSIISSEKIKTVFPKLDSILHQSITVLPKIFPAIKRGIPVTTVYELPIQID
jgi:hypothetical protein